jgi:hypothetical protein
MAIERVVGLPLLSELVGESITSAVDAVEVVIALGTLYEVAVAVGSGGESTRWRNVGSGGGIALAIHIVGSGGFLPGSDETFIIDRTNLVNAAIGSVGLYASGIVVLVENPLEMSADAVLGIFCQTGFSLQQFRE